MTSLLLDFHSRNALNTALAGGKGRGLARAAQAGLPVPPGAVLSADAYRAWFAPHCQTVRDILSREADAESQSAAVRAYLQTQPLPPEVCRALADLQQRQPESWFAVRSSGSAEDLPGAAFAGLHDTLLNVRGADALENAVRQCWLSLWNAEVLPYRERLGLAHEEAAMAVVVQQMAEVGADEAAGVAFSIDPVRGSLNEVLINAAFGLGETVVAGGEPVDEYRVNREGVLTESRIAAKPAALIRSADGGTTVFRLPESRQTQPALSPEQAAQVAELARRAEAHFGFPQDIEWAFAGGSLHLLQSRPVTRFAPRWTRDESAERFPNPVTPLTWQLCEAGFHESLNYSFRLMGLPPFYDKWFASKDGYIYGNQNAVEVYAGRLPLAPLRDADALARFVESGGLWQFAWISELPTRWMNDLDSYLLAIGRFNALDYSSRNLAGCWAAVREISAEGTRYFLPNIAISLTQTLLYRVLQRVLAIIGSPNPQDLFDRLTAVSDTKTADVNQEMWDLSRLIRPQPELAAARFHSADELWHALEGQPEIQSCFKQFLARHGHRETDFDSYRPTWLEAPQTVFTQIQMMASQDDSGRERRYWLAKDAMYAAERELFQAAPAGLHFFLHELLRLVRSYTALDDLEHYQTTRLTIPFRRAAYETGRRLVNLGALDDPWDIFFLPPADIDRAVADGDCRHLRPIAEREKAAYQAACARPAAWEYGSTPAASAADGWQGLGGSPGTAEGSVYVITDPAHFADFPQGAILVARTTNPAWTPLFYHAAGVITESGGPLSHGAVTARELGIPAVMGIRNACTRLANGQRVRIDGRNGIVEVLD